MQSQLPGTRSLSLRATSLLIHPLIAGLCLVKGLLSGTESARKRVAITVLRYLQGKLGHRSKSLPVDLAFFRPARTSLSPDLSPFINYNNRDLA